MDELDPNRIIDHLGLAEQHIAMTILRVDRQRQLIKDAPDGHDIAKSSQLLQLFEELLGLHIQDRDRARAKLAEVMKQLPGIDQPKALGPFRCLVL